MCMQPCLMQPFFSMSPHVECVFGGAENCRLIGSIDMVFECSSGEENGKLDSRLLAKLHAPVKPSCRTVESAGGNTHIVRFDENGEPGSRDCYTIHRCVCSTAKLRNVPHISALKCAALKKQI